MALVPSDPSPYWNPGLARQKSMDEYTRRIGNTMSHDYMTQPREKYDYLAQAGVQQQLANQINMQSSMNIANNAAQQAVAQAQANAYGGTTANVDAINQMNAQYDNQPRLAALMRALRAQESGGDYGVVNSIGAMGAYQIMPSNILGPGGWDQTALGRDVSRRAFLNHPGMQDKIVAKIFGDYFRKYGAKGALASWYAGPDDARNWRNDAPQYGGPSIHDYVMQVLGRL